MDFMEQLITEENRRKLLHNSYSNSSLQSKPTIAIAIVEQDRLIKWAEDLIDQNYKLWFIKRLKVLGKQHFIESANNARKYDGISRRKVFTHLMK